MNRLATLRQVFDFSDQPARFRLEFSERKFLLRLGDLSLIAIGIFVALYLWSYLASYTFDLSLIRLQASWIALIAGAWFAWLYLSDLYDLKKAVRVRDCIRLIGLGAAVIAVLYISYFFVRAIPLTPGSLVPPISNEGQTPLRLAPGLAIVLTTLLLGLWRAAYAVVWGGPHLRRRILVMGAGAAGTSLAAVLNNHAHFDLVGFVDDDPNKQGLRVNNCAVLGKHTDMLRLAEQYSVDELVIAISAEARGTLFQAIMDCHERGVAITPMPLLYEQLTGRIPVEHIGSQWYVALPFEPRSFNSVTRILKRGLDIVGGLVFGLIFGLAFPFVALAIKLDSKGSIFYSQERMGLHGQRFTVVKFRSMVKDAERDGKAQWAVKNDARITRVGAFIRKTRLDELPQVLNVLRGDMSLVGPRPERPQFIDKLQKHIPFYRTRLAAKPGLTGWAQVNYGYGSTTEDALIKLQYDLFYLKHQSAWFDLKILLRTVSVVLKMKGQ